MHDTKAHVSRETKFNCNLYLPIPFSMRFEPFWEHSSTQTSRQKLISLTKTKYKQFLCKNHVVWLHTRHQGASEQGNGIQLQSLFTHTVLNAFLTFQGALQYSNL